MLLLAGDTVALLAQGIPTSKKLQGAVDHARDRGNRWQFS